MSSFDFNTVTMGECPNPKCQKNYYQLKTTLHFSFRGNFRMNPIQCKHCGTSMFGVGSCLPPINRSIMSALVTSAQVFSAVGNPTIDVSNPSMGIDDARTIHKSLRWTQNRVGLRDKFSKKNLHTRRRQPPNQDSLTQQSMPSPSSIAVDKQLASLEPAITTPLPISEPPPVIEFDSAAPLSPSTRRHSAPPKGAVHRCDCFGHCHCQASWENGYLGPDPHHDRPYYADHQTDTTFSVRSVASTIKPPDTNPGERDLALLYAGVGPSNRWSQTSTEVSAESSVGILGAAPPRHPDLNGHPNIHRHLLTNGRLTNIISHINRATNTSTHYLAHRQQDTRPHHDIDECRNSSSRRHINGHEETDGNHETSSHLEA